MKYLFLSDKQRPVTETIWRNLPTLSQSTRECYLSVVNCKVILNANLKDSITLKMKIPSSNYFASDNDYPVVAFLNANSDKSIFTLEHDNEISILTNDNLKTIEFVLEDSAGEAVTIDASVSMEVMIKIDYVDQKQQTDQFILELPKRL